jgi:ABC-type transport system involved in cytochrome bd biosynthesis fused ATPase/permease subunit
MTGEGDPGRRPHPLRLATRKRVYLAMMGVCLLLIVLAWTVIYRYSTIAAVVMSVVALFVPPFAVIIANASSGTSDR